MYCIHGLVIFPAGLQNYRNRTHPIRQAVAVKKKHGVRTPEAYQISDFIFFASPPVLTHRSPFSTSLCTSSLLYLPGFPLSPIDCHWATLGTFLDQDSYLREGVIASWPIYPDSIRPVLPPTCVYTPPLRSAQWFWPLALGRLRPRSCASAVWRMRRRLPSFPVPSLHRLPPVRPSPASDCNRRPLRHLGRSSCARSLARCAD